jgi:hypothetical protein
MAADLPPWAVHVNDLPTDNPERLLGENLGNTITTFVGHLAREFPNPHVNTLMVHVWNLFGSRTVPVAMYEVPTMSFVVVGSMEDPQPILLVPQSWLLRGVLEPTMAVAALVFCGSQAVDFYNGLLLTDRETCMSRAAAYEAEFLLTTQKNWPETKFNGYQRSVLEKFPTGLPDHLRYEMKPTPTPPVAP